MSTFFSPETRAKIISAVKDEGMSIPEASKTFSVSEYTLRKWLRKQTRNAHTSSSEVQKLKDENRALKELIGDIILRHKLNKKSPLFGA